MLEPLTALIWWPISCYWSVDPPDYYQQLLQENGIAALAGIPTIEGWTILVPSRDWDRAWHLLARAGAWLA